MKFEVVYTPSFERTFHKLAKRNRAIVTQVRRIMVALAEDPTNTTSHFDIVKLTDVPFGEGQWRIRSGDYRVRYDIDGIKVIVLFVAHRKDSY